MATNTDPLSTSIQTNSTSLNFASTSNSLQTDPSFASNTSGFRSASVSDPALTPVNGLKADYYVGKNFDTLKLSQVDPSVNFNWVSNSPTSSLSVDQFSVRWTGQLQPKYSEIYTFYTGSDDGVRLWVNGEQIINNWSNHAVTENKGTIALTAGQKYDIKLEYYENTGQAVSTLAWSSLRQAKEIIPQSQLFLPPVASVAASPAYYVSTTGNDNNPGTLNAPFRTIQRAANVAKPGETVLVKGGTYHETVIPTNSGTANAPITFQAAPGETVSLRGTVSVPTNSWTQVGNTNTWYTNWPGGYNSSNNQSDQVFVNGEMVNLARWPQEANANLSRPRQATIDSIVSVTDTGKKAPGPQYPIYRIVLTDAEWNQPDGRWNGARIWVNTGGLDNGVIDDVQDGNGQTGTVIDTNLAKKQITIEVDANAAWGTKTPGHFQLGKGSYFYLFDPPSVDGLLYNNQFWHDRTNNRLYLRTPDGSSPSNHTVEVKQRDYAFNLDSRSYITIKGFDIFGASITTDIAAGNGQGNGGNRLGSIAPANNITLDGLNFKYVSHFTDQTGNLQTQWSQSSGVILSGSNNRIQNSRIAWSAGSGLVVIGKGNKALNNIIHDTNYTASEGGAVSLGRFTTTLSQDHEIGYNTIYNTGVDGIDFSALKNSSGLKTDIQARIHHNTIHDTVLQSADSGAIKSYLSDGGWVRIDHNVIYNTGGADLTDKYIFFGIYLDFPENKGEYIIDHNVIYNTPMGMNINGMKNVEIYNNTILARPEIGRIGIDGYGTLENVKIRNLLSSRGLRINTSGVTLSNNILNATQTSDWFVDATNPDLSKRNYRLVAGATQAINQGANVAPFNDATPPDIGAYEF